MTRKFKAVDYEAALDQTVRLREALPANHLARFVVDVVAELDRTCIYERYGLRGGEAYAPELLLALLFYGYATDVFSARKIEQATYETLPCATATPPTANGALCVWPSIWSASTRWKRRLPDRSLGALHEVQSTRLVPRTRATTSIP